ncbi:MAG: hypothetical protein MMC33_004422 [Icmadophila ericetorum]|nr:hypothetical protein [Icmadophila ericetorum]
MRDISIFPIYAVNKSNPKAMSSVALIDPPRRPVRMNPDVAVTRGLREVYNLLRIENTWSDDVTHSATITGQGESLTKEVFWRNLLVKEKDRQIAEISISHDAGCAVAVCLAANTVHSYLDELKPVVDDGKGPPMHEPEMDDAGYWEVNDMVKEVWARKGQEILVEDPLQKESVVEKPE